MSNCEDKWNSFWRTKFLKWIYLYWFLDMRTPLVPTEQDVRLTIRSFLPSFQTSLFRRSAFSIRPFSLLYYATWESGPITSETSCNTQLWSPLESTTTPQNAGNWIQNVLGIRRSYSTMKKTLTYWMTLRDTLCIMPNGSLKRVIWSMALMRRITQAKNGTRRIRKRRK